MFNHEKYKITLRFSLIFIIALIIIVSSMVLINLNWNFAINEARKNIIEIQKQQSHEIQKYLKYNFNSIEKFVSLTVDLIENSHLNYQSKEETLIILKKIALLEENMSTLSFADVNDNYVSVFRINNEKKLLFAHADETGELYSDYYVKSAASQKGQITQGFFASTRVWFTQSINSLNLEWHPVYQYYTSGNYGIGASKVVIKNNKPIGVVAIDYTLNDLSNLLISLKENKPGIVFIFDKSNKIIASNLKDSGNKNLALHEKIKENDYAFTNEIIKRNKNTFIKDGLIIHTSKIYLNKSNEYFLIDIVPEKNLLVKITDNTKKQRWIAVFIVTLTLVIFYFSLLYILKPIKSLEDASKKMTEGEWNIDFPKSRFLEISSLSSAYINMANKTQTAIQNLEKQVQQRTEKLNLLNQKLSKQALTDSLTNLGNRRHYNAVMNDLWSQNIPLSLAFIDIDFFKLYNDTYGHVAGDECLSNIGVLFKTFSEKNNVQFFRIGGEEFAITFSNLSFTKVIEKLDNLQEKIKQLKLEHKSSKISSFVTLSIGVTTRISDQYNWDELYKSADLLLYKAKQEGRNRIIAHSNEKN